MDFLSWHYSYGVNFYINRFKNTISAIIHQFSLGLLIPTLFAPWKRLVVVSSRKGFHPEKDLQEMMFNFISRAVGAVVRLILLITGTTTVALTFFIGSFGFILWLGLPFLSYSLYKVYKAQPEFVIADLAHGKTEITRTNLFNSDPGKFLILHIGSSNITEAFPERLKLPEKKLVTFKDLLTEILELNKLDDAVLRSAHTSPDQLILTASWWDERRGSKTVLNPESTFKSSGIGRSLLFGYTPTLDKFVADLGAPQDFSHHLIGREETVSRITRALTSGRGVMLTGFPGVGKKTVIYELAKRASSGLLGRDMSYKRILDFDYNSLLSGNSDINAKKTTFAQMLAEASAAGNVILVVRDIHRLTNSEVEGVDFTDIITEALENRKLFIISILDKHDYDRFVSRNSRLAKYFEEVQVKEINESEAVPILLSAARTYEKKQNILVPVPVLLSILKGSASYLTETPFPEKALELLDAVVLFHTEQNTAGNVSLDEVAATLSEKTGISLSSLGEKQKLKLTNLEDTIHKRLVNQEYPISLVAKALRAKTSGVVNNARPIGSFLFLGPTGVGKTETAKALAEVYFGSEGKILRFDMSEFAGSEGVERLIGNISKNIPGVLTNSLRNNPACLLLLDEIEKAPAEVFNLFLSLLDEGAITDAFGKRISASHTFVIATSNAGSVKIKEFVEKGVSKEEMQKEVISFVISERIFTPEFLNRFDGVVVYEPLTQEHLVQIAKLQLKHLIGQMHEKGIVISFSEDVYKKVVEEGYDPGLGARPMRRAIELGLGDFIANALLKDEIKEGDTVSVAVDTDTNEFKLENK